MSLGRSPRPVVESDSWYGASKGLDCVWRDGVPEDPPEDEYHDSNNLDWRTYKARRDAWFAGKPMALPEAPGEYDGRLVEGRGVFAFATRRTAELPCSTFCRRATRQAYVPDWEGFSSIPVFLLFVE